MHPTSSRSSATAPSSTRANVSNARRHRFHGTGTHGQSRQRVCSGSLAVVPTVDVYPGNDSDERVISTMIGVARILWGVTTAVASRQVYSALGISYPSSDLGVRIKAFGVRDIVLGAAALHTDLTVRRFTLRAGIAVDLIDAVVIADAAGQGLCRKAAVVGMTFAGGTAAFGTFGAGLVKGLRKP